MDPSNVQPNMPPPSEEPPRVLSGQSCTTLEDSSSGIRGPLPRWFLTKSIAYKDIMYDYVEHVAEPVSGQTLLQQPDVSPLKGLFDATMSKHSAINTASSSRKTILVRHQKDWGLKFYTRMDLQGYFCTYPNVGGSFQTLQEANNAIDLYLLNRRDPQMCMEGFDFSQVGKESMEMGIRNSLYWPDGTRRMRLKSLAIDESRSWERQLVKALVDKYNEDHNLSGDLVFELKDVVCCQVIHDGHNGYYHINFTAKTKKAYDVDHVIDDLFFAEVRLTGEENRKLVVGCTCMLDPFDNGRCYGCKDDMKHPYADVYAVGRSVARNWHCGGLMYDGPNRGWGETTADWDAEEAWVRQLYKGLDDPAVVERLMAPPKEFGSIKATDDEIKRFLDSLAGEPHYGYGPTYDGATIQR